MSTAIYSNLSERNTQGDMMQVNNNINGIANQYVNADR